MTDFRATARVRLDLACRLQRQDGTDLEGLLLDLGMGGGRIALALSLAPGELVVLELEGLRLPGRVKRLQTARTGWEVALEWQDLSPAEAARLAGWLGAQLRVAPFDEES